MLLTCPEERSSLLLQSDLQLPAKHFCKFSCPVSPSSTTSTRKTVPPWTMFHCRHWGTRLVSPSLDSSYLITSHLVKPNLVCLCCIFTKSLLVPTLTTTNPLFSALLIIYNWLYCPNLLKGFLSWPPCLRFSLLSYNHWGCILKCNSHHVFMDPKSFSTFSNHLRVKYRLFNVTKYEMFLWLAQPVPQYSFHLMYLLPALWSDSITCYVELNYLSPSCCGTVFLIFIVLVL